MTRGELIELLRMTLGSEEQADAVLPALDKAGLAVVPVKATDDVTKCIDQFASYVTERHYEQMIDAGRIDKEPEGE